MQNLKQKFANKSQLYKPFFLLVKISSVLSVLMAFSLAFDIYRYAPTFSYAVPMILSALFWAAMQVVAATFAEKFIDEEKALGLVIGFILAAMFTVTMFFPVGIFGLYSLFNKEFRENKVLENRPLWLSSMYEQVEKWFSPKKA